MKIKRGWLVAGGAAATAAAWYLYATSRAAARKVPYTVVEKDGPFELRDYPPLHVATSRAADDGDAFRRLFRFISRGNAAKRKIAMTTPVLIDRSERTMNFIMPPGSAVPEPVDANVTIGDLAGGRIAVLRFGGSGRRDAEQRAIRELRRAIAERGLQADGEPIVARYDPPWTPGPLRRNEIMLRVIA